MNRRKAKGKFGKSAGSSRMEEAKVKSVRNSPSTRESLLRAEERRKGKSSNNPVQSVGFVSPKIKSGKSSASKLQQFSHHSGTPDDGQKEMLFSPRGVNYIKEERSEIEKKFKMLQQELHYQTKENKRLKELELLTAKTKYQLNKALSENEKLKQQLNSQEDTPEEPKNSDLLGNMFKCMDEFRYKLEMALDLLQLSQLENPQKQNFKSSPTKKTALPQIYYYQFSYSQSLKSGCTSLNASSCTKAQPVFLYLFPGLSAHSALYNFPFLNIGCITFYFKNVFDRKRSVASYLQISLQIKSVETPVVCLYSCLISQNLGPELSQNLNAILYMFLLNLIITQPC